MPYRAKESFHFLGQNGGTAHLKSGTVVPDDHFAVQQWPDAFARVEVMGLPPSGPERNNEVVVADTARESEVKVSAPPAGVRTDEPKPRLSVQQEPRPRYRSER